MSGDADFLVGDWSFEEEKGSMVLRFGEEKKGCVRVECVRFGCRVGMGTVHDVLDVEFESSPNDSFTTCRLCTD